MVENDYFKGDDLAKSVWKSKYAAAGETSPDDEIWKPIENSNYCVSNYGRILNKGTLFKTDVKGSPGKRVPRILKNRLSSNKYLITFNNNFVHRLVAKKFVPNPNNYLQVNHIDGDKYNNYYKNLEWCTSSQNIMHAYTNKLNIGAIGEKSGNVKLTTEDVIEIRKLHSEYNIKNSVLAKKFNISKQQISKIVTLKRWKHLV